MDKENGVVRRFFDIQHHFFDGMDFTPSRVQNRVSQKLHNLDHHTEAAGLGGTAKGLIRGLVATFTGGYNIFPEKDPIHKEMTRLKYAVHNNDYDQVRIALQSLSDKGIELGEDRFAEVFNARISQFFDHPGSGKTRLEHFMMEYNNMMASAPVAGKLRDAMKPGYEDVQQAEFLLGQLAHNAAGENGSLSRPEIQGIEAVHNVTRQPDEHYETFAGLVERYQKLRDDNGMGQDPNFHVKENHRGGLVVVPHDPTPTTLAVDSSEEAVQAPETLALSTTMAGVGTQVTPASAEIAISSASARVTEPVQYTEQADNGAREAMHNELSKLGLPTVTEESGKTFAQEKFLSAEAASEFANDLALAGIDAQLVQDSGVSRVEINLNGVANAGLAIGAKQGIELAVENAFTNNLLTMKQAIEDQDIDAFLTAQNNVETTIAARLGKGADTRWSQEERAVFKTAVNENLGDLASGAKDAYTVLKVQFNEMVANNDAMAKGLHEGLAQDDRQLMGFITGKLDKDNDGTVDTSEIAQVATKYKQQYGDQAFSDLADKLAKFKMVDASVAQLATLTPAAGAGQESSREAGVPSIGA